MTRAGAVRAAVPGLRADLLELTKGGITAMVVVSTAVGMLLGAHQPLPLALWLHTLLGTGLVSGGASALNQVVEREVDALMRRTAGRPVPAGRMTPGFAHLIGVGLAAVGFFELLTQVGALPALLAVGTAIGYLFVYTPLKLKSPVATLVGAVPGAVPPLIGWAAAAGRLEIGAWALFTLLFIWQLPHFLAIAWMYKDDYARGGIQVLPLRDPDGGATARQTLLWCAALLPVSMVPATLGLAGPIYLTGALVAGVGFLIPCVPFLRERSRRNARRVLLASIVYQPVVLAALAADRLLA